MNKNSEKVVRYRIRLKQKLIEYKGGKCIHCGYCKNCPPAYDFHHKDPAKKDFQISGACLGFEKMKKEVDKCDLVCRNCHAEIHDKEWSISREKILKTARISVLSTWKKCPCCKEEYHPKRKEQKYCSYKCRDESAKQTERPSQEQLEEMLKTKTWTQIGREYGVSDNTVRKWMKK